MKKLLALVLALVMTLSLAVVGSNAAFKDADKVNGHQALAMILRAVGYDKNDEFTGAQWQLRVASTAQQVGVLQNVKGVDLNAAATRELVAELLFRTAAEVPMVKYTPAFGYVANSIVGNQKTLGEQNFSLKLCTTVNADNWGRPSNVWTYNTGNKKTTVVAKPVLTYFTEIDECTIARDLGITAEKKLEGAFIDGVDYAKNLTSPDVTTNKYATINPKAVASKVGAQGRLTDIYNMGAAGYRIVEVNTYLAKVTKVTAATTDVNGHTTDATVEAEVYMTSAAAANVITKTVLTTKATGFTVGQYILVTATRDTVTPVIRSIEAATVAPTGLLKT